MKPVIVILVLSQMVFSASDLLARNFMAKHGFTVAAFLAPWMVLFVLLRTVATVGQLYVLSTIKVGQTMALYGAASIIIANVLGLLLLKETLPVTGYIGVTLAVIAFLVLTVR